MRTPRMAAVLCLAVAASCGQELEAEPSSEATVTSGLLAPVARFAATLDDGSTIVVDNASKMSVAQVRSLVLAADRSTKSGCPYLFATKGLFKGGQLGDRIFVADYYLAWFDYTLDDGVGSARWSRSGALAGFWSLEPAYQGFRNFYAPYSASGERPDADGICWNWARNELLPGSNSPRAQQYWWDGYAPPIEHTIVVARPQSEWTMDPNSHFNLFSTTYPQGTSGSGFVRAADAVQNSAGVHYTTTGVMSSWHGDTSYRAANPNNPAQVSVGKLNYVLDFNCMEKGIQAVWVFSPTTTVTPINLYVDVWAGYSGLGPTNTCGSTTAPVPPRVFGVATATGPFHSSNYARSSLPYGVIDKTGFITPKAANSVSAFPWAEAVPCNGLVNVGVQTTALPGGVPLGATIEVGFTPQLSSSKPYLRLQNLVSPQQGDGSAANPAAFPFRQLAANYENTDQQQGLLLMSYNSGQVLQGGRWYIASYSLSSR